MGDGDALRPAKRTLIAPSLTVNGYMQTNADWW